MPETAAEFLQNPVADLPGPPADLGDRWMEAMLAGDFEAAWKQTDRIELPRRRRERLPGFARQPYHLVWNGEPFAGRRVLVRCEHGLGDSIQFLRYCRLLRREAADVTVKAQPMLLSLLEGLSGADRVINAWTTDPDPEHDVAIECMELPYAYRHTLASLPAEAPYLPVERIGRIDFPAHVFDGENLKVGLVWASSEWDLSRAVSLQAFKPLGRAPGVRFFSLQQGPESGRLSDAPFPIKPLSHLTTNIEVAARAMLDLDLIITVDNMVAHLAGALGRPVWVLLKHSADWRWMSRREDSPWYPTMRLFRQKAPGDWDGAIQQMEAELAQYAR